MLQNRGSRCFIPKARLQGCPGEIEKFYDVAGEGLKTKLGCILFQLPPSFTYSEERLETVIKSVDAQFTNVVEFRHHSWWRQDVMEAFTENSITFCKCRSFKGAK